MSRIVFNNNKIRSASRIDLILPSESLLYLFDDCKTENFILSDHKAITTKLRTHKGLNSLLWKKIIPGNLNNCTFANKLKSIINKICPDKSPLN